MSKSMYLCLSMSDRETDNVCIYRSISLSIFLSISMYLSLCLYLSVFSYICMSISTTSVGGITECITEAAHFGGV